MIAMFPRYPGGSPGRLGAQQLVSSFMAQMAAGSIRCTVPSAPVIEMLRPAEPSCLHQVAALELSGSPRRPMFLVASTLVSWCVAHRWHGCCARTHPIRRP